MTNATGTSRTAERLRISIPAPTPTRTAAAMAISDSTLIGPRGTWLFHCPELDLRLAGTIDQAKGQRAPYSLMIRMLRAWVG